MLHLAVTIGASPRDRNKANGLLVSCFLYFIIFFLFFLCSEDEEEEEEEEEVETKQTERKMTDDCVCFRCNGPPQ